MKKRILTGDRPTGKLHIGHLVGSIRNRVRLQREYDCYFIIADLHVLTTKNTKEDILTTRKNIVECALDYLACGIDENASAIYLQSLVPEVTELMGYFNMLVNVNHLQGQPSLKDMVRSAKLTEDTMPFGLLGYPVLQAADILLPKAHLVPVGKDNVAHVEITRSIAKRFNALYGEVFPIPEPLTSQTPSLVGTDGQAKMSKSLGNTIYLSDSEDEVRKKVRKMYTDPGRVHAHMPGKVEGNPVFTYLDCFAEDVALVDEMKRRYREGNIQDVEVKEVLTESLQKVLRPIREKRKELEGQKGYIEKVILQGTEKMRALAQETMKEVRSAMGLSGTQKKFQKLAKEFEKAHPL